MKDDPNLAPFLEKVAQSELTEAEREDMLTLVRKSDAIKEATKISNLYLQKALKEVEALPNHPMKKKLRDIALYMGKRKS